MGLYVSKIRDFLNTFVERKKIARKWVNDYFKRINTELQALDILERNKSPLVKNAYVCMLTKVKIDLAKETPVNLVKQATLNRYSQCKKKKWFPVDLISGMMNKNITSNKTVMDNKTITETSNRSVKPEIITKAKRGSLDIYKIIGFSLIGLSFLMLFSRKR